MALDSVTGSFTAPTSNGTQVISGLGFQPKLVHVLGIDSSDVVVDDYIVCIGAASGSLSAEQWGISSVSDDGLVTSNTYRSNNLGVIVNLAASSSTFHCVASLQSFDSDGFTLNWTTTSTAISFMFLAMGGSSLDVDCGAIEIPNTTGNFSKAGLGFQPKAVKLTGVSTPNSGASNVAIILSGFAAGSEESAVFGRSEDSATTTDTWRYQTAASLIIDVTPTGTITEEASLLSFDSDGFTLNATVVKSPARDMFYIAFGGSINAKTSSFSQITNGVQAVTGLGFEPNTTLMTSIQTALIDSVSTINTIVNGVGLGSGNICAENLDFDGFLSSSSSNVGGNSFVVCFQDGTSFIGTVTYDSNDSDGFTVTWTNSTSPGRNIYFLSIGDAVSGVSIPVIMNHLRNQGIS